MTTTLSFIVVLGILITVHELGHFLVAKGIGLGVQRFSIGFPPKMFGFTRGETEYCVSWIPLGGYVKINGADPDEAQENPGDPRNFMSRPPYQRAGVIIAGPLMNLVLAFMIMPLVFIVGTSVPSYLEKPAVAGWIQPDSPADKAGVRTGDRILAVNGGNVLTWEDFYKRAVSSETLEMVLESPDGSRTVTISLPSGKDATLGLFPSMEPVIGSVTGGGAAKKAGIREGDRILSIGGIPVSDWNEMARIIHNSAGKAITFAIGRDGELSVTPKLDERTGHGLVGISPKTETVTRRFGVIEAIRQGTARNLELMGLTFSFIWDLVTLKTSIKNLGGPIMIFQVTGQAAKAGLAQFIAFMAFLSLQLGILNLLPIPVLDGGHLAFLAIEGVTRKPLNVKTRETAQKVGFFLLLLLILVISYNDILRMFPGN
jgi:regulator of sigma E protease